MIIGRGHVLPGGAAGRDQREWAFDCIEFAENNGPQGRFFRRFALPVREYVLEIRFDADHVSARRRGNSAGSACTSRSGSVHVVELDATGLTWEM